MSLPYWPRGAVRTNCSMYFLEAANWPFGSALSMALMGVLTVFVVFYITVATREEQFGA